MKPPKLPSIIQPNDFMLLLVDGAFPKGTRIQTPLGYTRIKRGIFLKKMGRGHQRVGKHK
jgi:hypothetical protein